MSNISSTIRNTALAETTSTPKIYNLSIVSADTEYSQALTTNTKQLLIRVRGYADLKIAFTSTESGTNYITIPAGTALSLDNINYSGSIYFQSTKASQIAEILEWA